MEEGLGCLGGTSRIHPPLGFSSLAYPSLEETQELVHSGKSLLSPVSQEDWGGGHLTGVS